MDKDQYQAQGENAPYPSFDYPGYTSQKDTPPPPYTDGARYGGHGGPPTTSTSTVVVQPTAATTQYVIQPSPPSYLGLAIFTCICCCPIIGIIAIVYAAAVNDAVARGDIVEARRKSIAARNLSIAAIIVGLICGVIFTVIRFTVLQPQEEERTYYG